MDHEAPASRSKSLGERFLIGPSTEHSAIPPLSSRTLLTSSRGMGRLKQKGKAGAAKAYVTRSSAIKKLQCSLADFRRLCILKGIYPREPRSRKKANKGSSAPTNFYYAKDIAYLAHEPVLRKLREHKAFAKKLTRALGRGEWSSAKSLEENKPVYRLDHIIKERYPTFVDAVRDIDDALCMTSSLRPYHPTPKSPLPSSKTVFLSIKGVYYQAEVFDQTVTWLVPYQFTQTIPTDVDVRVMLTFLELYQTLLGFVFFKLYTDAGLVYPPPLDTKKDDGAAGVGAFSLQEAKDARPATNGSSKVVEVDGKRVSNKDVRQTIKSITAASADGEDVQMNSIESAPANEEDEEFVEDTTEENADDAPSAPAFTTAALPTLKTLSTLPQSTASKLFAPYTFWLSRETSRPIFEFIVRSHGGRIGWPATSGDGSPVVEDDESITHVIIDRPVVQRAGESEAERERRLRRKYVQPQWAVDCVNAGKILLEGLYAQGKTLPPHLSPFGERADAYDPTAGLAEVEDEEMEDEVILGEEDGEEAIEEDDEEDDEKEPKLARAAKAALKAAAAAEDAATLRVAELEAEAAGVDVGTFEKESRKAQKKAKKAGAPKEDEAEQDMNKMMMSNKQRKLYERMKYGEKKRAAERQQLEVKKLAIEKEKKRRSKT
ncbi:Pescadillo N-terminus-domain-containing protein [Epithele typhae]|uniref:Pescadillo N-terminus-domain-containing protein n=1 Tax=Epithele typhae TaxID=378194 RepID=UPI0020084691|nr:Pescadillo N-terminus-domain-containing protein [Epithele typhae]KAH9944466.1 Pescadillo N-terminus-domain-containing protein [Epithele typhae]